MKKACPVRCLVWAALACMTLGRVVVAAPAGTSFTYQGRLHDGGTPAAGFYDFVFELFDAPTTGSHIGTLLHVNEVELVDGYFTVNLDFGQAYNGQELWLQISVRPGGIIGAYNILAPRQRIAAAPYAQKALNDSDTLGALQCLPGYIPKWIDGRWTCAPDETQVSAEPPPAVEPADWKVVVQAGLNSRLQAVLRDAAEGRTFEGSLIYLGDDMNEKRRIDFFEAVPVRYEAIQYDRSLTAYLDETLHFKVGRVRVTTVGLSSSMQKKLYSNQFIFEVNGEPVAGTYSVEPGVIAFNHENILPLERLPRLPEFPASVRASGFTVDMPYQQETPDATWQSISGGALKCIGKDQQIAGYSFQDVLLQGDLSQYRQRKDLIVWINDWAQGGGKPTDGLVTIYDMGGAVLLTLYYETAVPVLYRPPAVNAALHEVLREELTFRAARIQ